MSWGKVKKINSNMNKPLDELLKEYHDEWRDSYTLVPSDNGFALGTGTGSASITRTFSYSGTVRILACYSTSSASPYIKSITVTKNGTPTTISYSLDTTLRIAKADFSVSAGDIITVTLSMSTSNTTSTLMLCGDLVLKPKGSAY